MSWEVLLLLLGVYSLSELEMDEMFKLKQFYIVFYFYKYPNVI